MGSRLREPEAKPLLAYAVPSGTQWVGVVRTPTGERVRTLGAYATPARAQRAALAKLRRIRKTPKGADE